MTNVIRDLARSSQNRNLYEHNFYMLIDQNYADVFSGRKALKSLFNHGLLGVSFHNEEVLSFGGTMTDSCQDEADYGILIANDGDKLPTLVHEDKSASSTPKSC